MASKQSKSKTKKRTSKKAYLYFIFPPHTTIDSFSVNKVKEQIKKANYKKLHFIVHSLGGDTSSAVKISNILRTKFSKIIGFVPFKAMSAATLMLLGANEIYMSEESQLGPLDLPMEHPIDGSPISALDVVQTLTQLSSARMRHADSLYEDMRENLSNKEYIGKNKAIELAMKYSTELVKPIAEKIDPYHRQKAFRNLKVAQWYAFDLLRTRMMKGKSNLAWDTARKLVHHFPDHSYAIFREEVKYTLKLNIIDSDKHRNWKNLCNEVDIYLKLISKPKIVYIEK